MQEVSDLLEALLDNHGDRRRQPRTQVEMPVEVLVIRQGQEFTEPVYLSAVVHDVSTTGALLSSVAELPRQRVWLRFIELPEPMYVEAAIVRTAAALIPMAFTYGIQFTRMLDQCDFSTWVSNRRKRATQPAVVRVTAGDVIDLGSEPFFCIAE